MENLVKKLKLLKVGDAAIRRNPLFYADAQRELTKLESADASARREWTNARLSKVLWAASRSLYGRSMRGRKELSAWPLLTKARVQSVPDAFRSGSRVFTVRASTGGTSGAPLRLVRSLRAVVFEQVCIDRMMEKLGANPRSARCAVLRTDAIKDPNDFTPPYWINAGGGDRIVFSASHLNAATVGSYAQALREFRPDCLLGYPTSLEALCTLLGRAGESVSVPRVLCSSEMLHPRVWEAATRTLGCALLDYYGQAERVAFAYAAVPGEYRFLPGYAHVELQQVGTDDGQNLFEIVGTSLWNLAMPLVRYRTGDLIRLPTEWGVRELEEVTLGLRAFPGVQGRDSDILVTPEGVKVTGISHFQRDVGHIVRIQVIQESLSRVRILVLAGAGYSNRDSERLLQNARSKLPATMDIEIDSVAPLERTALGKTPFVIHRPAVKEVLKRTRAGGAA